MTKYHAVMIGEEGSEFGVTFDAVSRAAAYDYLEENYPESRCDQLEDPTDTARREQAIYDSVARELDGDDYYADYEEEDDWDDYTDEEREEMNQRRAEAEEAAAETQAGYYM